MIVRMFYVLNLLTTPDRTKKTTNILGGVLHGKAGAVMQHVFEV